ncbi:NAD(P)-binding domain-containing protein [Klebsiella aerogenes]|uniref:NAD(P)-binding domain-containing protein n=1 Tax=Klebsiella aerogenes TaxID=548 RepID=UPI00244A096E|nr:NAD(P)-binding domain-containing protein [Klebsiella aerogenes]MDH1612240.1 NAD(P)-binding domain-containing protein [Klebsiella aerogenes]
MKIGFLGVGELTEKLLRGLLNVSQDREFYLSPRSSLRVKALSENAACTVLTSNQAVVDKADIIIIGVRPEALASLAGEVVFRPEQTVVSLMAGVSRDVLQQLFNTRNPVRLMMTYAAEINKTTVVLTDCSMAIQDLLSGLGDTLIMLNETDFELATVGMCMNGWLYSFAEQLQSWFEDKGMNQEQARRIVLGALRDCAEYATHQADRSLNELSKSIATPGTYTALGLEKLEHMQAAKPWTNAAESVFSALFNHSC